MKVLGIVLCVVGLVIAFLSPTILMCIVEPLLGMEAIVGQENVIRDQSNGYSFTNPPVLWFWITCIALVGGLIGLMGWALIHDSLIDEEDTPA